MKVVAPGEQVISVTLGDRSAPTKLSFTKDGDKLISHVMPLEKIAEAMTLTRDQFAAKLERWTAGLHHQDARIVERAIDDMTPADAFIA